MGEVCSIAAAREQRATTARLDKIYDDFVSEDIRNALFAKWQIRFDHICQEALSELPTAEVKALLEARLALVIAIMAMETMK